MPLSSCTILGYLINLVLRTISRKEPGEGPELPVLWGFHHQRPRSLSLHSETLGTLHLVSTEGSYMVGWWVLQEKCVEGFLIKYL